MITDKQKVSILFCICLSDFLESKHLLYSFNLIEDEVEEHSDSYCLHYKYIDHMLTVEDINKKHAECMELYPDIYIGQLNPKEYDRCYVIRLSKNNNIDFNSILLLYKLLGGTIENN